MSNSTPIALIVETLQDTNAPQHEAAATLWAAMSDLLKSGEEESDRIVIRKIKGMNDEPLSLTLIYPPPGGWK